MSLKTNKGYIIIIFAIILLVVAVSLFFPGITDRLFTGFTPFDSFSVSLSAVHGFVNISNRTQLNPVITNGTNITIRAPVIYYGNIVMNLTLDMPSGFECGFDWYINESGTLKNITTTGTNLTWEADKNVNSTHLYFEVFPPSILNVVTYTGDSYYEKTFTIYSCCPLENVSAYISVNQNYTNYTLYQIINSTLVNKTDDYNLVVANGTASFSGFDLSNKTFRLTAEPAPEVIETVIHVGSTGGGGGGGGLALPVMEYNTTKPFIVEPNYISVITALPVIHEALITIYNLRGGEKNFTINHTNTFMYIIESTVTIPHKEFLDIPVYINASALQPGKHTGYVYISDGVDTEKVTVTFEMLESQAEEEETGGEVAAQEQQPGQVKLGKEKPAFDSEYEKRFSLLGIILTLVAGLILVSGVIYFHLRRKN